MKKTDRQSLVAFFVIVLISLGMGWAGSQGGVSWSGRPLFALLIGLIFVIQWVAFVPAYRLQTEKFFDLTGSLTYISVTVLALLLSPMRDGRSLLLLLLVVVWAGRLGLFLFRRVHKAGKDGRFDDLKPSFFRFLNVWTIQGLWVTFTLAAALVAITSSSRQPLGGWALLGGLIWLVGFSLELVADSQKSSFRARPENRDQFIRSGVWAYSRHPNYLGEIILWIGIAVIAAPVLHGWQWVAMISPFFVTLLLTRVSGIPLLEKRADEKWGGEVAYEAYKKRTPVLVPWFK